MVIEALLLLTKSGDKATPETLSVALGFLILVGIIALIGGSR